MPDAKAVQDGSGIESETGTHDEKGALDHLFSVVYEDLRRIAASVRRSESHQTINTTALVHEAWLKLRNSPRLAETSLPHFKAIAARAMRQVLVEEARRRKALKRNAEMIPLPGNPALQNGLTWSNVLTIDRLLQELATAAPRQAAIVERRFFGGETVPETALVLGVSESVVERDWRSARAWLASKIRLQQEPG